MTKSNALTTLNETMQFLANVTDIGNARHVLALAQGLVTAAQKEYKATATMSQSKEDRDRAFDTMVKAGELKLRAEARLGQLIRQEQEAGRLATSDRSKMGNINVTHLKDIGLTKMDSSRAQKIAEHQDLIAVVVANSTQAKDSLPTRTRIERIIKEQQRALARANNEELTKQIPPFPTGKFKCLLIDPPWDWGDEGDVDQFGRAKPRYKTMSLEQIANFSVEGETIPDKADINAHLYLWITNRSLPKGFVLLERWGFRYITLLTWCKPSFGMGNYFRGQTEHVLFGAKGSCPLLRHDIGTWFSADRGTNHSAKPDKIYEIIESCSPGPWLEIFARRQRLGWASWGAEVAAAV